MPTLPALPVLPPLDIRLLGGFAVRVQGAPLRKLRTRQGNRLLALLALGEGRELERTALIGQLWLDSPTPEGAMALLRRTLTDLRDALGPEEARLESVTKFTLRLNMGGAVCDVHAFDKAIARGTRDDLDRAIDLYSGPLMPDLDAVYDPDGILRNERERRQFVFLDALHRRADERRANQEPAEAIADYRRLLAADPTREPASRTLMELLVEAADRAGAMAEFLRLRRALRRELGSEPERATRALYARIETGDLRDAPNRVAEIPNNLPHALSRFIGREGEIDDVRGLLRENRLLTLMGTGGTGKTRLAQQIASEVRADYPNGVWLVELAALTDASQIAQAVVTVLKIKEPPGQSAQETAIEHLKSRRVLLLLDNCEHLLSACATFSAALLRACPHVTTLATSREPLGLFGEQTYRVPSLTLPADTRAAAVTVASLTRYEATRLFLDRALLVRSDFAVTDASAPAIADLCCRLDGIPLALELAAARTRSLRVEEISANLGDRFGLLTVGDHTALPRQQTLRALVDWSYDLLTDAEKTLFARLSVFTGGWTDDAAQTVCGVAPLTESDVPDLLVSLGDKSLVQADEQADGSLRYRMLETLRQYAAEKVEASGETANARTRHRDWCAAMAEEADRDIFGPHQILLLTRLENDYGNLRTALEGFKAAFQDSPNRESRKAIVQQALRLTVSLGFFWQVRGYIVEARGHFAWILQASRDEAETTPRGIVARAFCEAARLAQQQGDFDETRTYYTESLTMYRALGEQKNVGILLGNLGSLAAIRKDWATAWTLMQEALDIAREGGNKTGIASALCNLGYVATNRGENSAAWELLTEALGLFRIVGENHGIAMTLNNLGDVAFAQGDYAAAQPLFEEALALRRSLEDKRGISFSLRGLAEVRLTKGDAQNAVVLWAADDALRESMALTLPPVDQAKYEQALDKARTTLIASGDKAFTTAWEKGQGMSWEQAVEYALCEDRDEAAKEKRAAGLNG